MEALVKRCAGLDVHKETVAVCVRVMEEDGRVTKTVRTYGTMTRSLLELSDWLAESGVTDVAMEATGVYWKPIYNILENRFGVLLVNAQHIKKVPGRKTDVTDCEWIAQLLQCGLLSGSFVPPRPQREWRDLTRTRAQLVEEKTRHVNRIQKVLEDANIKVAGVATDIMGKSGRDMIEALIRGETDPKAMAELARGRMRSKRGQLREALWGRVNDHHRYMLRLHYEQIQHLERTIGQLNERIEEMVTSGVLDQPRCGGVLEEVKAARQETQPLPFEQAVARADELPGIDTQAAYAILAEIGADMAQFPSEKHLCSWTRICPGNNESAGKRKSGKTGRGNRWLRRILTQVAWAASRTKRTYFAAQFRRIAKRRGKKRAIIAVAHSILTALYHMLKYDRHYHELGEDFFDRLDPERVTRYHVGRLEDLGYSVTLTKAPVAA
jgi:transposase